MKSETLPAILCMIYSIVHCPTDNARNQDRAALRLPNNPFSYDPVGVGSTPRERTVTVAVRPDNVAILFELKVWTRDFVLTIQHTAFAKPPIGIYVYKTTVFKVSRLCSSHATGNN